MWSQTIAEMGDDFTGQIESLLLQKPFLLDVKWKKTLLLVLIMIIFFMIDDDL